MRSQKPQLQKLSGWPLGGTRDGQGGAFSSGAGRGKDENQRGKKVRKLTKILQKCVNYIKLFVEIFLHCDIL